MTKAQRKDIRAYTPFMESHPDDDTIASYAKEPEDYLLRLWDYAKKTVGGIEFELHRATCDLEAIRAALLKKSSGETKESAETPVKEGKE